MDFVGYVSLETLEARPQVQVELTTDSLKNCHCFDTTNLLAFSQIGRTSLDGSKTGEILG